MQQLLKTNETLWQVKENIKQLNTMQVIDKSVGVILASLAIVALVLATLIPPIGIPMGWP